MRHVFLDGLDISRLGFGAVGMSAYYTGASADDDESVRTIRRALDLASRSSIRPIPGTKRVSRLEENTAATDVVLSRDQLARLSAIRPPAGDRYADMSPING
jgi:aryl-alcohol dehydrogenase-like predicted oxidoreductase